MESGPPDTATSSFAGGESWHDSAIAAFVFSKIMSQSIQGPFMNPADEA
jgi:hypothetical protein